MPTNKLHILLAEDDVNLGTLLTDYLQSEGHDVNLCKNGELALAAFKAHTFDVCLLDVMMPKLDGFSLAKEIRSRSTVIPILFITAKSMKQDKLTGYGLGADDYIIKPFDEEELLWKIQAMARRVKEMTQDSPPSTALRLISIGKYQLDIVNQALMLDGHMKRMTEKESEILKYLSDNRNTLVKRQTLLKELWGENDYFLGRSLDVFISKIRKYLKDDSSLSIENVFKVGFIFNVPDMSQKNSVQ